MSPNTLVDIVESVIADWHRDAAHTSQTATRMGEIAIRFARRLHRLGISSVEAVDADACRGFIDAPTRTGTPPTVATRHFRRVTLRALFRTLRSRGIPVGDPTLDIDLPPRSQRSTRPLDTEEVILGRTATFTTRNGSLQRAAAWALAEAAATTSEIPLLTRRHLNHTQHPTTVALPGTRRTDPRIVRLTDWGAAILSRHLDDVADGYDVPLVYRGAGGEVARQAATCKLISHILDTAGLSDPDIRPDSVRLWRAHTHHQDTGDLIGAARILGNRSLDRTAEALDIEWRTR